MSITFLILTLFFFLRFKFMCPRGILKNEIRVIRNSKRIQTFLFKYIQPRHTSHVRNKANLAKLCRRYCIKNCVFAKKKKIVSFVNWCRNNIPLKYLLQINISTLVIRRNVWVCIINVRKRCRLQFRLNHIGRDFYSGR